MKKVTKDHILHDSFIWNVQNEQINSHQLRGEGKWEIIANEDGVSFGDDEIF